MVKRDFLSRSVFLVTLVTILIFCTVSVFAQGIPYNNKGVSLNLPEGWVAQEIPSNFEKEVVGWLKSQDMEGVSILVFCYTGRRVNYNSVRVAGLKTIGASYPKGQEMLKKPTKMKTDTGLAAVWEYWRGAVETGGQTIFLESPMGIVQSKSGWILIIGYTPATSGPQLEEDFLKIINSVK
jgi:hypothetical protein